MMFLIASVTGDNSGFFLRSPCCSSFCYDNQRASVRTCPCKPLLTLSIIAVKRGKKTSSSSEQQQLTTEQDVGLSSSSSLPLPLAVTRHRLPHAAVCATACCRGASSRNSSVNTSTCGPLTPFGHILSSLWKHITAYILALCVIRVSVNPRGHIQHIPDSSKHLNNNNKKKLVQGNWKIILNVAHWLGPVWEFEVSFLLFIYHSVVIILFKLEVIEDYLKVWKCFHMSLLVVQQYLAVTQMHANIWEWQTGSRSCISHYHSCLV